MDINTQNKTTSKVEQGLRNYMLQVYNFMAIALVITGIVSYSVSQSQQLMRIVFGSPLSFLLPFVPFGIVIYLSRKLMTMSYQRAQLWFMIFAATMGLSLSYIFLAFSGILITKVFFITSSVFLATSLYGYTTNKDLSSFGSFLFMGVIGILIASVVNIFMQSSALEFTISVIGVLVFTGLTAYDTQSIKSLYHQRSDAESVMKKALIGSLSLYINFINLFLFILRLFAGSRN